MKLCVKLLFISAVFLMSFSPCALAEPKFTLFPFMYEDGKQDKLTEKITSIIFDEIEKTNAFEYVPPENFFPDTTDEEQEKKKGPLYPLERLAKGLEAYDKMHEATDIAIAGQVKKDNGLIEIESMVLGGKYQRYHMHSVSCKKRYLKREVKKMVASILEKSGALQQLNADEELDAEESIVGYRIKSKEGPYCKVAVDYDRYMGESEPDIVNVQIIPPEGIAKDGTFVYSFKTKERKPIKITFLQKGGQNEKATVTAEPPRSAGSGRIEKTLTVTSAAGYDIGFFFAWSGEKIKWVYVKPALNPYGKVK